MGNLVRETEANCSYAGFVHMPRCQHNKIVSFICEQVRNLPVTSVFVRCLGCCLEQRGKKRSSLYKILYTRKMGKKRVLCLFDVDGTLTEPRKFIAPSMNDFLFKEVMPKADVALVGGSDLAKISEQMGGKEVLSKVKYVFSENGLVAHNFGNEIKRETIQNHMGEEKLQKFINYALSYMSKLILPVKRGTFIEFRTGLINVSPVGRSCSQKERDEFEQYDKVHKIREKFITELKKEFPDSGLIYSIGGQISFDVFPEGWDKTYCLNHIQVCDYDEIHFFGDKTEPGGNDHEIYNHPLVIGHKVTSPEDTKAQLTSLLNL